MGGRNSVDIGMIPGFKRKAWGIWRTNTYTYLLTSVLVLIFGALSVGFSDTFPFVLFMLLSLIPTGLIVQMLTVRGPLHPKRLRLQNLIVGRKTYDITKLSGDEEAKLSLLLTACRTYRDSSSTNNAVRQYDKLEGLFVTFAQYGPKAQSYAFVSGAPSQLLETTTDMWDMGHVRKLTPADKSFYMKHGHSAGVSVKVAHAYAPLPTGTDINNVNAYTIIRELTFLGVTELTTTRAGGRAFSPNLQQSLKFGFQVNSLIVASLWLLGMINLTGYIFIGLPLIFSFGQLLIFKLVFEPLLLATLAWDNHKPVAKVLDSERAIVWDGLFISFLVIANYLAWYGRYNISVLDSLLLPLFQDASAVALATLAGCLYAYIIRLRGGFGLIDRHQHYNPYFLVASAAYLLAMVIMTFVNGPLVLADWMFVLGAVVTFLALSHIRKFAAKHHTRDHIIDLYHRQFSNR